MFTWNCIVLSLPKRDHVDWNWPISREKYVKIDWSVNNAVALDYYGSYRLLLMGSWFVLLALSPRSSSLHPSFSGRTWLAQVSIPGSLWLGHRIWVESKLKWSLCMWLLTGRLGPAGVSICSWLKLKIETVCGNAVAEIWVSCTLRPSNDGLLKIPIIKIIWPPV